MARESLNFTLKGNRAERVQIMNVMMEAGRSTSRRRFAARLGQSFCVSRHVFHIDAAECDAEFMLRTGQDGKYDSVQDIGACFCLLFAIVGSSGGAQNIIGRHQPTLAGEFVSAAGTANAFQYAVADERLKHRLEMTRRQTMARREGFCGNGASVGTQRYIDNRSNCENSFAGEERHVRGKQWLENHGVHGRR